MTDLHGLLLQPILSVTKTCNSVARFRDFAKFNRACNFQTSKDHHLKNSHPLIGQKPQKHNMAFVEVIPVSSRVNHD